MTITHARSLVGGLIVTVWLLAGTTGVSAQDACVRNASAETEQAALAHVEALFDRGCLGGPTCDSALCKKVAPALNAKTVTPAGTSVLLYSLLNATDAEPATWSRRLRQRMSVSIKQYETDQSTDAAAWDLEDMVLFKDDANYEIPVARMIAGCTTTSACTKASSQAQAVVELARLFGRLLTKINEADRNAFAKHLAQLDTQWRAYLSSSRGQYPWELAANSALYKKTEQFDAPPTSQWIFGHPGAAFELTGNSGDTQPSESLLLEVFGRYFWKWEENKMVQRLGGSVTLAWRDTGEGEQKLGYGVLVYLPRQSTLGYLWRPQKNRADEHALVLSADLVKFIRGTQGIKERLRGTQ